MNIASLREIGSVVNFGTDETIIQQGETGEDMFILLKGTVEVVVNSEFVGNEVKIAELKTGDLFGEMSMVGDEVRSATIRALSDCTVFRIHKENFSDFIIKDTTVAIKMLKILSSRLVEIREKTMGKTQKDQNQNDAIENTEVQETN